MVQQQSKQTFEIVNKVRTHNTRSILLRQVRKAFKFGLLKHGQGVELLDWVLILVLVTALNKLYNDTKL